MRDDGHEQHKELRRIEEVEEELAGLVRVAKGSVEETTMSPVIGASEVDRLRKKLTDARSDLVESKLEEQFSDQLDAAQEGDVIVFDEVRGTVKNIGEMPDDE